jgi:hypothetical protein
VQSYVSGLQAQHSGLPNLSGSQYEDNQLVLYGGYGSGAYIWVPNSNFTGWTDAAAAGNGGTLAYNYVYAPKTSNSPGVRNEIQ